MSVGISILIFGCATQSAILYERKSKQQISLKEDIKTIPYISLQPESINLVKDDIEVFIKYTSKEYLDKYFKNKELFGKESGLNPYIPGTLVFYVKISNKNREKIKFDPNEFVMLDDNNSQYSYLSPEYIIDLYTAKRPIYSFSKTTAENAPGLYGAPLKFAGEVASGPLRRRLFLLKSVTLTGGYIFNDVIYDGYIAFPIPNMKSSKIKIVMPNIQRNFSPNNEATNSLDFDFEFEITRK